MHANVEERINNQCLNIACHDGKTTVRCARCGITPALFFLPLCRMVDTIATGSSQAITSVVSFPPTNVPDLVTVQFASATKVLAIVDKFLVL